MIVVDDIRLYLAFYMSEERDSFINYKEWVEYYGGEIDTLDESEIVRFTDDEDYLFLKLKFKL